MHNERIDVIWMSSPTLQNVESENSLLIPMPEKMKKESSGLADLSLSESNRGKKRYFLL